ncbi:MAG: carbonic anhydrase [Candidatus Omnitrophica bacterium]|nr:carbonic anhydrase [Candidatus Omnitrophota bacterium]
MAYKLHPVNAKKDIPAKYKGTPIGDLLEYHNLDRSFETYAQAKLLIGMCMDNRKHLHMPDNFAFIIRSGGANLRYSEFKVSFAIAIGGVRHIAVIAHTNCGMVNIAAREKEFVKGLVEGAGWTKARAEEHFMNLALVHEIENEIEFVYSETQRLRKRYPKVVVAPLYYKIQDNRLYCIESK